MAEADPALSTGAATPDASVVNAAPDTDYADNSPDQADRRSPRWRRLLLMIGLPLLLAAAVAFWWFSQLGKESTDNAQIRQDSVAVTAQVTGPIAEVLVKEGDTVQAGQLLFRIDPAPFRLTVQQADAALASAQANVTALSNVADLSGADIAAAREDIAFAQTRLERQQALWDRGFTTRADYDAAGHAVEQARARMRAAEARQIEARAQLAQGPAVPGVNPQIASARAARAEAELSLTRSEIRAPSAGRIAQADRLQVGEMATSGLPLLQIVRQDAAYVEANFKETQLGGMRVGQRARIEIDAFPGMSLTGHVSSIGAGTGSEFSILPAQNATGNWVKVTQRVPVRVAIDQRSPRDLIAGLSATVTVFTEEAD